MQGAKLVEVNTEWLLRSQRHHQFYRRSRAENHNVRTNKAARESECIVYVSPTSPSNRRVRIRESKESRM